MTDSINVFVTADGDGVGRLVGRAVLHDAPEELARVSQAIERGEGVLKAWALQHGGRILEAGGDEATLEVPAGALAELEAVRKTYETAAGTTLSVGVGRKLSEAAKALMVAKLRGKDRVVVWAPELQAEIDAVQQPDEAGKLKEEYLAKAGAGGAQTAHGHRGFKAPSRDHAEHSEGAEAEKAAVVPDAGPDFEAQFRAHADGQAAQDQAGAQHRSANFQALKAKVSGALEAVRGQLPVLQQLKGAYPDTYASVLQLVQGVIDLGRQVSNAEDTMQKAEGLAKGVAEIPQGAPVEEPWQHDEGVDTEHDYSHVLSPAHRAAGYALTVEHRVPSDPQARQKYGHERMKALLTHKGIVVGHVDGHVKPDRYRRGPAVEPHSYLQHEHRGKGLGSAMYEALFAHAHHAGIQKVEGGPHSADAHAVHRRLADKHGFSDYDPEPKYGPDDDTDTSEEPEEYGRYSYNLKAAAADTDDDRLVGPGRGCVFVRGVAKEEVEPHEAFPAAGALDKDQVPEHAKAHRNLDLPVGSIHNGEIAVRHADGTKGWKGVISGLVAGQERDAALFGANSHPVSSRNPGGK